MNLARRHIKHRTATVAIATRAIRDSAYVVVTPLPGDWYEVAVKPDRASLLPDANGRSVIDPDSPSSGDTTGSAGERSAMK